MVNDSLKKLPPDVGTRPRGCKGGALKDATFGGPNDDGRSETSRDHCVRSLGRIEAESTC